MAPDDIINENDGEQEEEQEQEPNIIDLNNYGMKPYAWRYEGSGGGGGGSFAPEITDPQDGDTLVYNAAQQKWVNGAGGSGGGYLKITADIETGVLDKTWQEIHDAIGNGWYCAIVSPVEDGEGYTQMRADIAEAQNGEYSVWCGENVSFSTDSADGYPVFVSA